MPPLLSVIIPVYNEEKTIRQILEKIEAIDIDKEIIVVNDASSDKTAEILGSLRLAHIKIYTHNANQGKGNAFRTGLKNSRGDIVIIQDADLEYDPSEYYKLIGPVIDNRADLVLGARFTMGYHGLIAHRIGNRFLTNFLNLLYGSDFNDVYTCYKAARREVFNSFNLKSNDFALEQEIVAKALKMKLRITEIPISYYPRSYAEGKKIRYHDAVVGIIQMLRLRFSN